MHVEPPIEEPASSPAPPTRTDSDQQIDEKLAEDPIAQAIPMLYNLPKQKQLETLYWLKHIPREKLLQALPRLGEATELSYRERQQLALDAIDGFIEDLEQQGIKARRFR